MFKKWKRKKNEESFQRTLCRVNLKDLRAPKAWADYIAHGHKMHEATASYGKIWERSISSWIRMIHVLASGANGTVAEIEACRQHLVMKIPKALPRCGVDCTDPLTFEYSALKALEDLRHRIPNFPLVFGLFWTDLYVNEAYAMYGADGVMGKRVVESPILIMEKIEPAETMTDWLTVMSYQKTEEGDRQVARAVLQVMLSLVEAQKAVGFTSWDLHTNNVVWQATERDIIRYRMWSSGRLLGTVPILMDGRVWMIIDAGRAFVTSGARRKAWKEFGIDEPDEKLMNIEQTRWGQDMALSPKTARFIREFSPNYDLVRFLSCVTSSFAGVTSEWKDFSDTFNQCYPTSERYADSPGLNGYISDVFPDPASVVLWWQQRVPHWFTQPGDQRKQRRRAQTVVAYTVPDGQRCPSGTVDSGTEGTAKFCRRT